MVAITINICMDGHEIYGITSSADDSTESEQRVAARVIEHIEGMGLNKCDIYKKSILELCACLDVSKDSDSSTRAVMISAMERLNLDSYTKETIDKLLKGPSLYNLIEFANKAREVIKNPNNDFYYAQLMDMLDCIERSP